MHPDNGPYLCEKRDRGKKTARLVLSGNERGPSHRAAHPALGFITAKFSPDGKKVLFTDGDPARKDAHRWGRSHRPYVLDVATKARTPLADFPEHGQGDRGDVVAGRHAGGVHPRSCTPSCWRRTGASPATTAAGDEGNPMVADADGRNAKTIATDKAASIGNSPLGAVDWR